MNDWAAQNERKINSRLLAENGLLRAALADLLQRYHRGTLVHQIAEQALDDADLVRHGTGQAEPQPTEKEPLATT